MRSPRGLVPWSIVDTVAFIDRPSQDVEGYEYDLLPATWPLVCAGIDHLMLERHDRFFLRIWRARMGMKETPESKPGRLRIKPLDEALEKMQTAPYCRTLVSIMHPFETGQTDQVAVGRPLVIAPQPTHLMAKGRRKITQAAKFKLRYDALKKRVEQQIANGRASR